MAAGGSGDVSGMFLTSGALVSQQEQPKGCKHVVIVCWTRDRDVETCEWHVLQKFLRDTLQFRLLLPESLQLSGISLWLIVLWRPCLMCHRTWTHHAPRKLLFENWCKRLNSTKTGRGESTREQRQEQNPKRSSNRKLWESSKRCRRQVEVIRTHVSQSVLISVYLNRVVLKQQGGYGTSDRWLLHSAPTQGKKKEISPPLDSSLCSSACLWTGFVWVLLHLHLCLTHCLISADKNINRRANSGASSAALALHFVLPRPSTCSC